MNLEDLNLDEFKQLLLDLMHNKEAIIKKTLKSFSKMDYIQTGISNIKDTIESGSDTNLRKQLRNIIVSTGEICGTLKPLLLIQLILISTDDFNIQISQLGNKLGFGEEFLKEMFKQKLDR